MDLRAAVLILLILPGAARAQDRPTPELVGLHIFTSDARQNGRPVCTEMWTFGADGRMEVESGDERVGKRFRLETDRDGVWLVTETLSTNGRPDCTGAVTGQIPVGERRTYLVPMNDGRILTCPPPGRAPDGGAFVSGCYGAILPADLAG